MRIMNVMHLAMSLAIASASADASKVAPNNDEASGATGILYGKDAKWPSAGTAERIFTVSNGFYPENMFVEEVDGRLHAWVLLSSKGVQTKALDFFSGTVLDVQRKLPGGHDYTFVDNNGVTHKGSDSLGFFYSEAYRNRQVNGLWLDGAVLDVGDVSPCLPIEFQVIRRRNKGGKTTLWSKVPLYSTSVPDTRCPDGVWDSEINTTLDLADGTMLVTAGDYIFRVRQSDMSPVGDAPHLRVIDAGVLERAVRGLDGRPVGDATAFFSEKLGLRWPKDAKLHRGDLP
jgi:hypothetical protein